MLAVATVAGRGTVVWHGLLISGCQGDAANHDNFIGLFFRSDSCDPTLRTTWAICNDMVQAAASEASSRHAVRLILALAKALWIWPSPISLLPNMSFAFALVAKLAFAFAFSLC